MSRQQKRREILRSLFLALWAMFTMVLFFMVVLLVREMLETGGDPLAALRPESAPSAPEAASASRPAPAGLASREIRLYFATPDASALVPEPKTIEYSESTVENCRAALAALAAGPRDILTPVLDASAKVRALYLREDGELVVDFSRELQSKHTRFKSASLEALMLYAIVNTVSQDALHAGDGPVVRTVRILIEGMPPTEVFPGHLSWETPVAPDTRWVAAQRAPGAETPADG